MIKLSTTRDLAATVAGLALAVMAADELGVLPPRLARRPGIGLAPTRHGWLCGADGLSRDRARRLRPATEAEAAASAASRAAGDGGWFGLAKAGDVVPVGDPRFARAGRDATYYGDDRVDVVFVADPGRHRRAAEEAAVAAEALFSPDQVDADSGDGRFDADVAALREFVAEKRRARERFGPTDLVPLYTRLGRSRTWVQKQLTELCDTGEIVRTGHGGYSAHEVGDLVGVPDDEGN